MASRGGPMVTGTNGADFEHREKIAAQYQIRYVIWLIYKYLRPYVRVKLHVECKLDIQLIYFFDQVPSNYF